MPSYADTAERCMPAIQFVTKGRAADFFLCVAEKLLRSLGLAELYCNCSSSQRTLITIAVIDSLHPTSGTPEPDLDARTLNFHTRNPHTCSLGTQAFNHHHDTTPEP